MTKEIVAHGSDGGKWMSVTEGAAYLDISRSSYRKLLNRYKDQLEDYTTVISCSGPIGETTLITKEGLVVLATMRDSSRNTKGQSVHSASNAQLQGKKKIAERAISNTKMLTPYITPEPLGLLGLPIPTIKLKEPTKQHSLWTLIGQLVEDPTNNKEYAVWWNRIYGQLLNRYNKNIPVLAKNRKKRPIDVIAEEGLMEEAYAIAYMYLEKAENPKTTYPYET